MGLFFLVFFYFCEEEGSLINKNFMYNFWEKEGSEFFLVFFVELKIGRDKFGFEEGICVFLLVFFIRSFMMKLEFKKFYG